jgi:nicotinate-nucleotide adenylyltransferase
MLGKMPSMVPTRTAFGSARVRMPHAQPGQRIGLLGGSFNPPHEAHRLISQIALSRLGLDEVWWLVSPGNPLKSRAGEAPLAERIAQAKALAADARIRVTGLEADLPTAFTASTLSYLRRRHPQPHYVWLMGADNLATIHRWQAWRSIFDMMPVAVIDRPGWHLKALAAPAARVFASARVPAAMARCLPQRPPPAWVFLTGPLSEISSTAIRARKARSLREA